MALREEIMHDATAQDLKNFEDALAGNTVALSTVADRYLPELLEQVDGFVAEHEAKLAPARAMSREIRNEIERRLDAQGASQLKLGGYVVRFETVPARALVRTEVLREPGVLDELRELVPSKTLEKAVRVVEIPATTEIKTHLTYLRKIGECGERAAAVLRRLVDEGIPGRRLVIERDEIRIGGAN